MTHTDFIFTCAIRILGFSAQLNSMLLKRRKTLHFSSVPNHHFTMKVVRFLLIVCLTLIFFEAAAGEAEKATEQNKKCSEKSDGESCTQSDLPKSRQKRVVSLPNQSSLTMQSRLIVPQPPVGLYIIWVRVRFFIRSMFTSPAA